MINRLNRSHFAIIPPSVYQEIERAKKAARDVEEKNVDPADDETAKTEDDEDADEKPEDEPVFRYGIGIDLRLLDDNFVITRVAKDSAGDKAGLKPGFIVDRINSVALADIYKKITALATSRPNLKNNLPLEIVEYMLNGERDSAVRINYRDQTDQPQIVEIEREPLRGENVNLGQNFPEQHLRFEVASLDENVGYIRFNLFSVPTVERFCEALTTLKDKKAIIIDLRGNIGGLIGGIMGIGSMLTDKPLDLGTQIYKVGSEKMISAGVAKHFTGKLVVLADNLSISSAEILTAALKENNRAVIVGEKTAGQALPSIPLVLPTGAVLIYPIANFKTPDGNLIEGKGVEPDVAVKLTRQSLLAGHDAQLEKALQIIKNDAPVVKQPDQIAAAPSVQKSGEVTIKAIPPPPPPPPSVNFKTPDNADIPPPPSKKPIAPDARAARVIGDFFQQIGGAAAFDNIKTYRAKGFADLNLRGVDVVNTTTIIYDKTGRYEQIFASPGLGEIREVYLPDKFFVQTDFGLINEVPMKVETERIELFSPIKLLRRFDSFKSLKYDGEFDRLGKKVILIEFVTDEGQSVAMSFDAESKLLVSAASTWGRIDFDDYRKTGDLLLPFSIDNGSTEKFRLETLTINAEVNDSDFAKKIHCYDQAE